MTIERYVIHVTKKCNLDCLYCYEKDKISEYTWKEIKNLIDNIVKLSPSNTFGIEFLGGEPMLEWGLIRRSYEYLESMEGLDVIDYIITTNGTIVTDDIIDYLAINPKLNMAISLDGHMHSNQLRVFKEDGKNSYFTVMENIKRLLDNNIQFGIHMVTHPYNVGFLADSIIHLYNRGIKKIDIGTIESTMKIDDAYCKRFIKELDYISKKIVDNSLTGLSIGLFNWLKPYEDVRSYIKDPDTGKVIAESYGRNGNDITHSGEYEVNRCSQKDEISEMIYHIRETVYYNHQRRLKNDN